jgi:hypothetical protein
MRGEFTSDLDAGRKLVDSTLASPLKLVSNGTKRAREASERIERSSANEGANGNEN